MIYTNTKEVASLIQSQLESSERILLLTHHVPDGDAIGCTLALWHMLTEMRKTAILVVSPAPPHFASELPAFDQVQSYEHKSDLFSDVDLIWISDTALLERLEPIYKEQPSMFQHIPLIIVDHHDDYQISDRVPGKINLIDPTAPSCAEVLYALFSEMKVPISSAIATCLLLGIITDTNSFQSKSIRPQTMQIAAELLASGADHQAIIRRVYNTQQYSTEKLLGFALSQMQREENLVWTHVSQEMEQRAGARSNEYYEAIEAMQRIEDVQICALFYEKAEKYGGGVKVSLRSSDIDVVAIAKQWPGGGGREQAAAMDLPTDIDAAMNDVLPELKKRLI